MPRVPSLSPAPILAAPMPQVRQQAPDAEAFGANLGQGIEQASRTAFGIWKQEMDRANEAVVLDANTRSAAHDLEARTALKKARGLRSQSAFEEGIKSIQQKHAEIEKGLANPVQREAFRRIAAERELSFENWGAGYVVTETHEADRRTSDANMETGMNRLVDARNDWPEVAKIMEETVDTRLAFLRRDGAPMEELNLAAQNIRSIATARVLDGLVVDKNYREARRLYEKYGAYIRPDVRAQVASAIHGAEVDGESTRVSGEVLRQVGGDAEHPDMQRAAALVEQATAGASQELRDEAMRRTSHLLRLRATTQREEQTGTEAAILNLAHDPQAPLGFDDPRVQVLWRQLTPERATKMREALTKQAEPDPVQSRMRLMNYELLIASPDPETRRKVVEAGPLLGAEGLSAADQRSAIDLWTKAKMAAAGQTGARKQLDGLTTKHEAVAGVLRAAGYAMKKGDAEGYDPRTAAVLNWIDREAKALQASRTDRRDMSTEDWTILARKAVAEQVIKGQGTFGGDITRRTADTQAELVQQIPAEHRSKLEESFNALNGRFPTATELLQEWEAYRRQHPEVGSTDRANPPAGSSALLLAGGVW